MDFPIFHLDFFGNRLLIAGIAILHVFINHPLAVGAIPLITLMEWWGHRTGKAEWDVLARRTLLVCFIITTSVGALTGVGIWFSASVVNPYAIGSLIRVFFWAWFTEWLVFFLEVVFIMIYYLTWKQMQGARKALHVGMGATLAAFSWITMAIITAILGFMMDPGHWMTEQSFLAGVFNPVYLPQLAFRTTVAMTTSGLFALFLIFFFTRRDLALRAKAVRLVSVWVLAWLPLCVGGSLWYWGVVPEWMVGNLPTAMTTQDFTDYQGTMTTALGVMAVAVGVVTLWGVAIPRRLPGVALLVPFLCSLFLIGTFERVREFVRKPYIIGEYMYANGLREADYPLYAEEGILAHATYVEHRTTTGVNGAVNRLEAMYGTDAWDRDVIKAYIQSMHNTRAFMPPFPGNDAEAGALADYLLALQRYPLPLEGAQRVGVTLPTGGDGATEASSEGGR
jgi:hypothetical protein